MMLISIGDRVEEGEPLALIMTDDDKAGREAQRAFSDCVELTQKPVKVGPRIRLFVDSGGVRPWVTPLVY